MFFRTEFIWRKKRTVSNVEFTLHSAGIPNYILCADDGKLVIKVNFWNAFKYLTLFLKWKNKQKDEFSLVSWYNGQDCHFLLFKPDELLMSLKKNCFIDSSHKWRLNLINKLIHPKPHIHAKNPLSGNISTTLRCIKYCYSSLGVIYAKGLCFIHASLKYLNIYHLSLFPKLSKVAAFISHFTS